MTKGHLQGAIAALASFCCLGLATAAVAHPPDQHDAQRAVFTSPEHRLQNLLDTGALNLRARYASLECRNGSAGPYECKKVDLESFVPLPQLGGVTGNDIWGWTDPKTGKEYAIVGTSTSVAFVDISDPKAPEAVGFLPTAGIGATVLWRDVKVYDNHAFIVSEIDDSGMQVFDLRRLRDESGILDADAFYDKLSNTHNIAINEESGFAYAVGNTGGLAPPLTTDPEPCESSSGEGGGLHMIDVRQPKEPKFAGCAIVGEPIRPGEQLRPRRRVRRLRRADAEHAGDEICFGSNENAVVIYDVTDKANPVVLSETTYPTAAYTHQGTLTEDREFFIFGDELDEGVASSGGGETVDNTTTYVMSIADLENPGAPNAHTHESKSIDHNMYVHNGRLYQSNYAAGLRIHEYDNESLARGELREVAYFDFLPGVDVNDFAGTWSNYPFFESGLVVVSAIEEQQNGLLVLRPRVSGRGPAPAGSGGGSGRRRGRREWRRRRRRRRRRCRRGRRPRVLRAPRRDEGVGPDQGQRRERADPRAPRNRQAQGQGRRGLPERRQGPRPGLRRRGRRSRQGRPGPGQPALRSRR